MTYYSPLHNLPIKMKISISELAIDTHIYLASDQYQVNKYGTELVSDKVNDWFGQVDLSQILNKSC